MFRQFIVITIWLIMSVLQNGNPAIFQSSEVQEGVIHLQNGIQHADNLEIDEAIQELQMALQLGLSEADRIQAYYHLALMYKAEGQIEQAQASLMELLKLDIDYQLSQEFIGTDFEELLRRARAKADRETPELQLLPIPLIKVGQAIEIEVRAEDNSQIKAVQLTYQHSKDKQPQQVMMEAVENGKYRARIPGARVKPGRMQWQITAIDAWNNGVQTAPISIEIKGQGKRWGWYLGGALVGVAGSLVGYNFIKDRGEWPKSVPPGPPGN